MSTHAWVHTDCVGLLFWKSIACVRVFMCSCVPVFHYARHVASTTPQPCMQQKKSRNGH